MKLATIVLSIKELGLQPVFQNIIYRIGVKSGYYRLTTASYPYSVEIKNIPPQRQEVNHIKALLAAAQPDQAGAMQIIEAADEITRGTTQLYGAIPTSIRFIQPSENSHWCDIETGRIKVDTSDIKDIWEPARFSWVFPLGQAYHLTGDEKYPTCFWEQFETFLTAAPPNVGPYWMNGQEAALRLISFIFANQVFDHSPQSTPQRKKDLYTAVAAHARRIAATLIYARSQQNNHLLSEAAGLYTAGLLLKESPETIKWKKIGWKLFIKGVRDQIAPDGSYIQNSTNYHRMMLHLAIWVQALSSLKGAYVYPDDIREKIILAVNWLEKLVVSDDGHVPNMGANDGANILPLGGVDVLDFRPVLRLAKTAFQPEKASLPADNAVHPEQVAIIQDGAQTACMRVARYLGRPSHADQLHVDLWWRNRNIALDAGTYRYNYPSPWDNALAGTSFHNTISIDARDQMIRAGRFLWLKRAHIRNIEFQRNSTGGIKSISAEHDGFRQFGIIHKRTMTSQPEAKPGWFVQDELLPFPKRENIQSHTARLVWLLPDWNWKLDHWLFQLQSPEGMIKLFFSVKGANESDVTISVFRAGSALTPSNGYHQTWGWYSPTYGIKLPILAVHVIARGNIPMQFTTHWCLPN